MVSAPTTAPTARPRRARNQVAAILSAGGYTPARQTPAAKRLASSTGYVEANAIGVFTTAPSAAAMANNRLAGTTSARLSNADPAVPTTKPSCTAVVSAETSPP